MTIRPGSSIEKPCLRHHFSFLIMVLAVSVVCLMDTKGHFVRPNILFVCAGIGLTGMVWCPLHWGGPLTFWGGNDIASGANSCPAENFGQ
jgi:hypothetical protein